MSIKTKVGLGAAVAVKLKAVSAVRQCAVLLVQCRTFSTVNHYINALCFLRYLKGHASKERARDLHYIHYTVLKRIQCLNQQQNKF